MKRFHSLMLLIHRILGTLLSFVFLMWFVSGIVMIYHGKFPRPDREGGLGGLRPLSETTDSLPPFSALFDTVPDATVSLDRYLNVTSFHVSSRDTAYALLPDGQPYAPEINAERIRQVVRLWCDAPVSRIDTLTDLCQWTPFSYQRAELPILRYYFDDAQQHQLFIGTASGTVLQYTTHEERVWSWLGPIPHWIYFTLIRENFDRWCAVIYWLAGLGILMTVSGLWVGILRWRQARRHHKFSPYRKPWYHWHYATGLVFGLFVITFAFSGIMSLAPVPHWLSRPSYDFSPQMELSGAPSDSCRADYREVIARYPDARRITWSQAFGHPVYRVDLGKDSTVIVDASDSLIRPLLITPDEVRTRIADVFRQHGADVPSLSVSEISSPELYYRGRGDKAFPAIKAELHDADNAVVYVQPQTGQVQYVDNTSRWGHWLYPALHSLRIPGLIGHELLRQLLLWILLLGGAAVSLSGVVLGIRYIRRTIRFSKG